MLCPHFHIVNVITILGRLYFPLFRGEISERTLWPSPVCELGPRPCQGKGVEVISKTWFLPSRGLQALGRGGCLLFPKGGRGGRATAEQAELRWVCLSPIPKIDPPFSGPFAASVLLFVSFPLPGALPLSSYLFFPCWQTTSHLLRPKSCVLSSLKPSTYLFPRLSFSH